MTTQSQFLQTIDRPAMSTNQILFGLALVLVLAVGSQLLARPLRAPALVMLVPAGFVAGVATDDVHPDKLLGSLYQPFVSIAVGVILFEAGLRLSIAADGRPPSVGSGDTVIALAVVAPHPRPPQGGRTWLRAAETAPSGVRERRQRRVSPSAFTPLDGPAPFRPAPVSLKCPARKRVELLGDGAHRCQASVDA